MTGTGVDSVVASGHLFKPRLSGAWAGDQKLGQIIPDILWLKDRPCEFNGGEVLVELREMDGQAAAPLVWRQNSELKIDIDLERSIRGLQQEEYRPPLIPPIATKIPFNYNVLPNSVKGILKAVFDLAQKPKQVDFPKTPIDLSCDFLSLVEARLDGKTQTFQWPDNAEIALTLSHDVDTAWVLRHRRMLERIIVMEKAYGFRSTWHLVSNYLDDEDLLEPLEWLSARGHELGSHGDNHDTRHPFASTAERQRRWQAVVRHARQFDMCGIRSAWLTRTVSFFDDLAGLGVFRYDSSVPNSEKMGVAKLNSGCTTMRPFFLRPGLVELPVGPRLEDMAQHDPHLDFLNDLLERLRVTNGFLTINMHPQPHQSANPRLLDYYERVLETLASQQQAWCSLQRDVADWFLGANDQNHH